MAFNIFERWPWTSFQNLNLDWLMNATEEAVTKAEEASETVGQFDARITANSAAIEQLGSDIEQISGTIKIVVSSDRVAAYHAQPITGSELRDLMLQNDSLPYVVYNNEVYMLDTVSTAGDMRFSMGHTVESFNELVIRHLMIPAQSSNAAYSITNVSSGGGSADDVFTVIITDRGDSAEPEYIFNSTFDTIRSQMAAGRTPVFQIKTLSAGGDEYNACGSVVATTGYIDVYDPLTDTNIGKWRIYPNDTVARFNVIEQLATLDDIVQFVNDGASTNALLKTPQILSAAQKAQVKTNIGIVIDPTLTISDAAADAKVTGDEIGAITNIQFTEYDGYYSANGVIYDPSANTQEKYTSKIIVNPGDTLKIKWKNPNRVGLWIAYGLFTKNNSWISRTVVGNANGDTFEAEVTIPNNARYISFCYRTYGTSTTAIEYKTSLHAVLSNLSKEDRKSIYDLPWFNNGKMRLHAHGGLSSTDTASNLIYNSIPAFEKAGELGMFVCETDLRRTSDGYYVCSHNDSVDSSTNGTGRISEMTLEQVRALRLLRKDGTVSDLQIPTQREFLIICKKYNMIAAMELKDATQSAHFESIINGIKDCGMMNQSYVLHSNTSALPTIRNISDIPVVFVAIDARWTDMYNAAIANNYVGITYDVEGSIDQSKIENCHNNGVPFDVYTVNTKEQADSMFNLGVDMVTTDYLDPTDWLS